MLIITETGFIRGWEEDFEEDLDESIDKAAVGALWETGGWNREGMM